MAPELLEKIGDTGFREYLMVYLKGLAMGSADSVPGVSGGTIAMIVGIYERLIDAITSLDPAPVIRLLPRLNRRESRQEFLARLREMDVVFLTSLGLGVVTAVALLSRLVHFALNSFRGVTFAFFLGLILASVIVLYEELNVSNPRELLSGIAGFGLAFLLAGATAGNLFPSSAPFIFLAGMLAISAMVLPGISGAFILLLLGQYEHLSGVLSGFTDSLAELVTAGSSPELFQQLTTIGSFGAGAVTGIFTVSYAVEWMLEHYRRITMTFLVSLMAGSLRLPAVEVLENTSLSLFPIIGVILSASVGAGAVLLLDFYTDDLDY
jgi:putative membrane protein